MQQWNQWAMAFDDKTPLYQQIRIQFSRAFVRAEIRPGDRIPSIREMSGFLRVNTNTIQRAYQDMERNGLINSRRGTGYFFTEDIDMLDKTRHDLAHESLNRFVVEMRALGCKDDEIINELDIFMKGGETGDTDKL